MSSSGAQRAEGESSRLSSWKDVLSVQSGIATMVVAVAAPALQHFGLGAMWATLMGVSVALAVMAGHAWTVRRERARDPERLEQALTVTLIAFEVHRGEEVPGGNGTTFN